MRRLLWLRLWEVRVSRGQWPGPLLLGHILSWPALPPSSTGVSPSRPTIQSFSPFASLGPGEDSRCPHENGLWALDTGGLEVGILTHHLEGGCTPSPPGGEQLAGQEPQGAPPGYRGLDHPVRAGCATADSPSPLLASLCGLPPPGCRNSILHLLTNPTGEGPTAWLYRQQGGAQGLGPCPSGPGVVCLQQRSVTCPKPDVTLFCAGAGGGQESRGLTSSGSGSASGSSGLGPLCLCLGPPAGSRRSPA